MSQPVVIIPNIKKKTKLTCPECGEKAKNLLVLLGGGKRFWFWYCSDKKCLWGWREKIFVGGLRHEPASSNSS